MSSESSGALVEREAFEAGVPNKLPWVDQQRILPRLLRRGGLLIALSTAWPAVAQISPPAASRAPGDSPVFDAESKSKFNEALGLYRAGNFATALPLFSAIVEATRSPNAELYVGHCLVQLGRPADAYRAFSLTVREIVDHPAEKYEPTREAAQAQLANLELRVAKLAIVVPEAAPSFSMTLDGHAILEKDFGSSIVLDPGIHSISAGAPGFESLDREVKLEPGESKAIPVLLKKSAAAEPPPPVRPSSSEDRKGFVTAGVVAGGVGLLGITTFAIAGLAAKSAYDGLDRECTAGGCSDQNHLDQVNRGKSMQTIANVGLVVGGIGIATGGVLLLLSGGQRRTNVASLSMGPGSAGIQYGGRFP